MKTRIFPLLVAISILISSCTNEDLESLYNTYRGIYTPVEGLEVEQERAVETSFEFVIRIEDDQTIYINDQQTSYDIIENTDDYIILEVEAELPDQTFTQQFKYLKGQDELIMLANEPGDNVVLMTEQKYLQEKLDAYVSVPLTGSLDNLSDNQKEMLRKLFQVADIMDELFWLEAYGDKVALMATTENQILERLFEINYGPWNRLNNNQPFLPEYGEKYPGANFYPSNMTREEFRAFDNPAKTSLYTLLRRDENGNLMTIWYHDAFEDRIEEAALLLREAAELSEDEGFRLYLLKRADALLTDEYYESDVAWMKMKDNDIDFVVGPIENYEDQLFNYKAAHEAFILIKDHEWSERISELADLLPMLQQELPVDPKFKTETPGSSSDLNVYEAVYYAGDCNAGSKTIAINLPNDPEVRANYGSRKLQLKNSIRYKFEKILIPISNVLIAEDQRKHIDFNSFFENTMFHEVAHGLGVDYTINGKGSVREALKENYSAIEEGKADILGLYIVTKLTEKGELGENDLMNNYVTFMASIFRSIRFGASSAHGKANMIRFNYFRETGAFTRDEETGTYRINFERMKESMEELTQKIISIQGTGDYDAAGQMIEEKGLIEKQLQSDLERLEQLSIPVDLVFEQGPEVLGL